jgi:hypothetical protein
MQISARLEPNWTNIRAMEGVRRSAPMCCIARVGVSLQCTRELGRLILNATA